MDTTRTSYSASMRNLRSLLVIRSVVITGQSLLLWYLLNKDVEPLTLVGMSTTLLVLALLTALSFLRTLRDWPVTDTEYAAQVFVDMLGLSALLYFSGGASNPFVSYYLVPLVIAAALLPRPYTWSIAAASLLAYSLLLYFHVPLPLFSPQHSAHGAMNIHVIGMWVNFFVSVCLITYFVVGMSSALRRQEREANEKREDALRNDQIMAVAGLAAGTAHELGTPLATITLLVEELDATDPNPQRRSDYQLISQQLARCKRILEKLSRTAQVSSLGETHRVSLSTYIRSILEQWLVTRPDATATLFVAGSGESPLLEVELTLAQAIENLLNNAANAWARDIRVELDWSATQIGISVIDKGPGIPLKLMDKIGKPILRDGGTGLGLGLLLSHATINRYGGEIELQNMDQGGARVTLRLPRAEAADQ